MATVPAEKAEHVARRGAQSFGFCESVMRALQEVQVVHATVAVLQQMSTDLPSQGTWIKCGVILGHGPHVKSRGCFDLRPRCRQPASRTGTGAKGQWLLFKTGTHPFPEIFHREEKPSSEKFLIVIGDSVR